MLKATILNNIAITNVKKNSALTIVTSYDEIKIGVSNPEFSLLFFLISFL